MSIFEKEWRTLEEQLKIESRDGESRKERERMDIASHG